MTTTNDNVLELATQNLAISIQKLGTNVKDISDDWHACYQTYLGLPRSKLRNDTFEMYILYEARFTQDTIRYAMYACYQMDFDSLKTECRNKADKMVDRLKLAGWWELYFWFGKKVVHSRDAMRLLWRIVDNGKDVTSESIHIALDVARKARRKGAGVSNNPHVFILTDVKKATDELYSATLNDSSDDGILISHSEDGNNIEKDSRFEQNGYSSIRLGNPNDSEGLESIQNEKRSKKSKKSQAKRKRRESRGDSLFQSNNDHLEMGLEMSETDNGEYSSSDTQSDRKIGMERDMKISEDVNEKCIEDYISTPELPRKCRKSLDNWSSDQVSPIRSPHSRTPIHTPMQLRKRKANQANIESNEETRERIKDLGAQAENRQIYHQDNPLEVDFSTNTDQLNEEYSLVSDIQTNALNERTLSNSSINMDMLKTSAKIVSFNNDISFNEEQSVLSQHSQSILSNGEKSSSSLPSNTQPSLYFNMMEQISMTKQAFFVFDKDAQFRFNQLTQLINRNDAKVTEVEAGIRNCEESCDSINIQDSDLNKEESRITDQIESFDKWVNDFPKVLMKIKEGLRLVETRGKLEKDLEELQRKRMLCKADLLVHQGNMEKLIEKKRVFGEEAERLEALRIMINQEANDVREGLKHLGTIAGKESMNY